MPRRHGPTFAMSTPAPREIHNWRVWMIALIASQGALIFGYDLAFIGTTITLKSFKHSFALQNLSKNALNAFSTNIVSLLLAGCFFGNLFAAPLGNKLGRRPALMVAGAAFSVGSLMQTLSSGHHAVMFVGRTIGGLGVGAASNLVPLYVAELAPPSTRGRLVGLYEVAVQLGSMLGFWICYAVAKTMPNNASQWITPFAIQLIPGVLLVVGMFFVPESPRWHAQHRSREVALAGLAGLRKLPEDHPYLQEELTHILDQIEDERRCEPGRGVLAQLRELTHRGNRRRIAIGMLTFFFMILAGSNAINYYSPLIFHSIGVTGGDTDLFATGVYGVVRFVAVTIVMNVLIDRVGRRRLLMTGAAVMAFAMWYIGAYVKIANPGAPGGASGLTPAGYSAIVMIYIYAVGWCLSFAGIPWILASEIFPMRVRSVGMSLCVATHWALNFLVARVTPYMLESMGYGTYFFFAAFITTSIAFVYFCVPETKGLSLEEMDVLFNVPGAGAFHGHDVIDMEKAEHEDIVMHVEKVES